MFSVGYSNNAMVINTINQRRINFLNIEKLRKLALQTLRNPCKKLVIDLQDIKFIDSAAFDIISQLKTTANRRQIEFVFANIDKEVLELFELIPEAKNFKEVKLSEVTYFNEKEVLVS